MAKYMQERKSIHDNSIMYIKVKRDTSKAAKQRLNTVCMLCTLLN